jgi:hypothetical protein
MSLRHSQGGEQRFTEAVLESTTENVTTVRRKNIMMDYAHISNNFYYYLQALIWLGLKTYFVCFLVHHYIDEHVLKKIFPFHGKRPTLVDVLDMAIHRSAPEEWRF